MFRKFAAVFALVILCASGAYALTGSGSEDDPYILESYADFIETMIDTGTIASENWYILSTDIDLTKYADWPGIGTKDYPFAGHFDGQGNTIRIDIQPLPPADETFTPILTDRALFGYIRTESGDAVKNLNVEGSVRGYNAGGIVSILEAGAVRNCSFLGSAAAKTRTGDVLIDSLVSELKDYEVQNADDVEKFDDAVSNKVEHRGKINAGGIAGVVENGEITGCAVRAEITAEANLTPAHAGGIAGRIFAGNISGCYVDSGTAIRVSAADESLVSSGGIAGLAEPYSSVIENNLSDAELSEISSAQPAGEQENVPVISWRDVRADSDDDEGTITFYPSTLPDAILGRAYSVKIDAYTSESTWGYSLSLVGGSLPNGLSFKSSGQISGTPREAGTFTFTLSARFSSTGLTATQEFSLLVINDAIEISTIDLPDATVRREYSTTLTATSSMTGDTITARWTLSSGSLPDGLTLSRSTGEISGTPAESGEFTFSLTAASGDLTDSQTFTLYVNAADFSITSTAFLTPAVVDEEYTEALTTDADTAGRRIWYTDDDDLPPGLILSRDTGVISGTPTTEGTYTFRVRLFYNDQITSKLMTLVIVPGVSITTSVLPAGVEGREYSQAVVANIPLTADSSDWYISDGTLPPGLRLDRHSGVISGIPTQEGAYTFTVSLLYAGNITSKALTLTIISGAPVISITTGETLPPGTEGKSYYQILSADTPSSMDIRIWYVDSGDLPSGMNLYRNTGVISGTPASSGTYSFRVRLRTGDLITAKTFTLLIIPGLVITTESLDAVKEGEHCDFTLKASEASAVWSLTEGTLPSGLSMDSGGKISGIPETGSAGEYTFTVQARLTSSEDLKAEKTLSLTIQPEFSITTGDTLPRAKVGQWYSQTLSSDADAGYLVSWEILSGDLPDGVMLSTSTGTISGTPQKDGLYTFTVQATAGRFISVRRFTLIVESALEILTDSQLEAGKVGIAYSFSFTTDSEYPVLWAHTGGYLPDGLTFNAGSGTLSGTPTTGGTYTFTLSAESGGMTASKTFTIEIGYALTITTPAVLPSVKAGAVYSYTLSSDAEEGAEVLWSLVERWFVGYDSEGKRIYEYSNFPSGLYIEEHTGTIYGSPTEEGVYKFRIQAVMGNISVTKDFTLTVRPTLAIITDRVLPHAVLNERYSAVLLTDAEDDQIVTWQLTGGNVPEGFTLDEQTGELIGYALSEGVYTFTVRATSNGLWTEKEFELTAGEEMSIITSRVIPVLKAGDSFSLALQTDKDDSSGESWSIVSGRLPPGLSLDSQTGIISGTPTRAGKYTFTVQCQNGYSLAQREFTITVDFVISGQVSSLSWQAGVFQSHTFTAEGVRAGAVLWSASRDVLPTGLTLSREGILSGTTNEAGEYTFTLYAFVSNDVSDMKIIRLSVGTDSAVPILTTSLPDGRLSEDYSAELRASLADVEWSVSAGSLPDGLRLAVSRDVGVIAGRPVRVGEYPFTVSARLQDREGSKRFTITIVSPDEKKTSSSGGGGGCDSGFGLAGLIVLALALKKQTR